MPEIGHLDPVFVGLMSKIQTLLRHVWQTQNQMTIPVSQYYSNPQCRNNDRCSTKNNFKETN
jgi:hypothetical protein